MRGEPVLAFRAAVSAYLILGGVFGGAFAFTLHATVYTHPSFWKAAVTFGVVFAFVLIWLAAFEIRITGDELVFRSLLGGTKRIAHRNIRKIHLGVDMSGRGGLLKLIIEPRDNSVQTLTINAKVFPLRAIREVLDLGNRVATADSGGLEEGLLAAAVRKRRQGKLRGDT